MATAQAGYAAARLLAKPDRVSKATQFLNISQGQNELIDLNVASTIFQGLTYSGLKRVLARRDYSVNEIQAKIAGAMSAVLETVSPGLRGQYIDVIVQAIDSVWLLAIFAGVIYTLCFGFMISTLSLLKHKRRLLRYR